MMSVSRILIVGLFGSIAGCITASRAEELAKDEYRRTVLHPKGVETKGLPNCDGALDVLTDELWNGYRVSVLPRADCLGNWLIDADGKYFVWKLGGHVSPQAP
jgi:hypothetical protein